MKTTATHSSRASGFTLIELIVVIVVIGILAGLSVFGFTRFQADARDAELLTLVHQLKGSAGSYGFPRASELARECQDLLRAGESRERLAPRLSELLREMDRIQEDAKSMAFPE